MLNRLDHNGVIGSTGNKINKYKSQRHDDVEKLYEIKMNKLIREKGGERQREKM